MRDTDKVDDMRVEATGTRTRGERVGWDIAIAAVTGVLLAITLSSSEPFRGAHLLVAATILAIALVYLFGARPFVSIIGSGSPSPLASFLLQFALIALLTVGVWVEAHMFTMQTIVMPLIWMTSRTKKQAIRVTIALAVILGLAGSIREGFSPDGVITAFVTSFLSAAFSLAIGLWITQIAAWGSERQALLAQLTAAQDRLEAASREAGAGAERERIARDLHDTIAQNLASIVMLAERVRRDGALQPIETIEDIARDALREARTLVVSSSPAPHGTGSLADALRRVAERFARETGMQVAVDAADVELPRDIEVVLLRCAQEALANVRKHAEAGSATISLAVGEEDRAAAVSGVRGETAARLTVRDDGRGLGGVTVDDDRGFGLSGMRERVGLVGGSLLVRDAPGGGVELRVSVPLGTPAEAGAGFRVEGGSR